MAGKVISRRNVEDHYRAARAEEHSKAEEHPRAEVDANEDPSEDINEVVPEDMVVAAQQRQEDSSQPSEDSAAETWMIKVNHDEVKSEILSDVFDSEVESKLSPYHNLSFDEE